MNCKKRCLVGKVFFSLAILVSLGGNLAINQSWAAETEGAFENKELIPGREATSDLIKYLENIYTFGIAIAGILAVVMISLGAFSYIVTAGGNSSKMIDAKKMIFDAIFGLILALVAYLLLFVINPDLVKGTVQRPFLEIQSK